MFRRYSGLWLLLTAAMSVMLVIAFSGDLRIGNYSVRKAPFADMLLGPRQTLADSIADAMAVGNDSVTVEAKVDSLPQSFFIFGDSMTFNLALRLAQYAKANGHSIHAVNWDSSNTRIWAENDTLANCIARYRPTQIFISLGSNELYFKDPSSRLPYVRKILEVIDTIPYIWIGPPNWDKDNGMNDLLRRACRPGSFFRSEGMEFKRKKDHVHPTRESSFQWMDSIIRWSAGSAHPFIANMPSDSIGKVNPNVVFLKALNK